MVLCINGYNIFTTFTSKLTDVIFCFTDGNSDREPVNLNRFSYSVRHNIVAHLVPRINGYIIFATFIKNQPMPTRCFADGKQL